MKKKSILFIITITISFLGWGQQQAMYTQYMFNGLAINPAYAGSHQTISMSALARFQWVGIEGAPRTQTFSLHSPIPGKKASFGLLFSRDEIGVSSQNALALSAAYRIDMRKGTLSLGLQGGLRSNEISYADLSINDPKYQYNLSGTTPDVGAGIYFYNSRLYAGVSIPSLLKSDLVSIDGGSGSTSIPHFFFTTGIVLELSPVIKLKPSTLIKYVSGAPMEIDVNANLILDDKVWIGASYRSLDAISFLLDFQATTQLRVGYSYDYGLTDLARLSSGSHEIMLNYRFVFRRSKVITPRYF